MAARQPLEQPRGDTPGPAARVEDGLAAFERQAVEHPEPPPEHRVGDALVDLGVPVADAHRAVVTGPGRSRSASYVAIASSLWSVVATSSRPFSRRCLMP